MSHLVKQINQAGVIIKDLDLLDKACTKLGLQLHKDRKRARYYGTNTATCDAVITVPGCPSEIAVFKRGDAYEIQADTMYGEITQALGNNSDNLFQRYKVEEITEVMALDNWLPTETFNAETQCVEVVYSR